MELYGSLFNISGSVTASAFTGSYIGDGAGLYNLPASGVTGLNLSQISSGGSVAAITSTGFTVNTNTQVQGNLSVTGALIANEYIVSSSVVYMTTSFASGSSAFGNDNSDVHQFTGSVQITGSISLNGQAIGTGKLDETVFQSYTSSNDARVLALETSSGSLNSFTSSINTTIKSKLDAEGVISGSVQVNITGTTGYNTFSSSISSSIADVSSSVAITTSGLSSSVGSLSSSIATTDLNQSNRLDSIEGKTGSYATTGSNIFIGNQTHSGSIIPSVDNTYDLGSSTHQWRDVYISSGSLYIDGTKVISSTAQELQITTDNGQSIKILESGTDSIILQTADGDIELKSNADGDILLDPTNGKIMLKGPVEILTGQKIQSSVGGTPVVFANDIVVSGSIDITGTIEGINLTDFSSSANTRIGNLESSAGSLNSYTSSNTTNINAIHTATSSLNTFTSSINTTIKSKLDNDGVISGSVQVVLTGTTGYSTFSSSVSTSVGSLSSSIAITTSDLSSSVGSLSSSVATTTSGLTSTITSLSSSVSSSIGSLSSSVATTTSGISSTVSSLSSSVATTTSDLSSSIGSLSSSVATTTSNIQGRVTSLEGKTGSYATTGSNVFKGDQTISGSVIITENLTVFGSSSITYVTSSQLRVEDNIITVNTASPGQRFGGLEVHDSGSVGIATGSLLWDSVNNRWIYQNSSEASYGGGVLLSGPRSSGSLGSELTLTSGRIAKSAGGDHLNDSNISDDGTTVTINSATVINGTIISTGTTIVSGSSQISHDSTTGYVANKHIDHTSVSITAGNGLSGGGDISATRTVSLDTSSATFTSGVKSKMNTDGVISGSSQVLNGSGVWSGSAQLPSGVVSGSSQVLSGTGIWSGSAQLPSGVVSGSSQVLAGTTIHSGAFFNGISVVSGSAQISFNGITDKPTLVSGSSQITYGSLSGIPSGIVSGSSQITFGSISSIPGGLVSGSSQIDLTATTNYSTGIKTRLNAEGVLSGSAQVSFGSITGVPSGLVSGSSQVSLASTTGFGTYINQALLTTSTPTFSTVSATTFTGALSGNATTATTAGALTSMNISQFTNNSGYITGISFANVSSKPTTLSGYGITDALTNNTDSEQVVGCHDIFWNYGSGVIKSDGRWNESGYDADLGTLHMYSTTAAGVNYGRAGIALYNGSAYQYLTTKASTTGLFANNSLILTAGNYTSYAMAGAGYSANQNLNTNSNVTFNSVTGAITSSGSGDSNAPFRFAADYSGWMSLAAGSPGSNNGWGLFWAGNSSAQYGTNGAGGPGDIWSNSGNPNEFVFVGNGSTNMSIHGNTGNVWVAGDFRNNGSMGVGVSPALKFHVRGSNEMVRFENTSTTSGQYAQLNIRAGNRNGYIWLANENTSSWAGAGGLNIYTENGNIDLWSNAVQRVRLQTDGHLVPYVNNTYDLGSASLGWRNVYTNDLHLSNMNKPEGNDVDGTNGNWTIQEGLENLYIINNNNGKKFKISLEEII